MPGRPKSAFGLSNLKMQGFDTCREVLNPVMHYIVLDRFKFVLFSNKSVEPYNSNVEHEH